MLTFDHLTTFDRASDTRWTGTFPADWAQGRSVFGGATAGACLRALDALTPGDRTLLCVDTAFIGPVAPDTPTELETTLLRAGKHVTTLEARLSQHGALATRLLATYGRPRPSRIELAPPRRAPAPWAGEILPFLPGVTPTFVQHFELAWAIGGFPFTGASEARLGGRCRHRTHATGHAATLGLVDAWPAPVLPLTDHVCAASTVRWTVHLHAPAQPAGTEHFFEAHATAAHAGYATTVAHLFAPDGSALATSEQLVAVFDER